MTGANDITPRVIRGTVTSLALSDLKEKATLSLDMQKITITRSGKPISMSDGDCVIVAGTQSAKGFCGTVYINESNGDNSVDEVRAMIPKWIAAGTVGLLGVLAVLATAAIAAVREPSLLSVGGVARIAIYIASIAAALVLGAISLLVMFLGAHLHGLIQMIDREHLKSARTMCIEECYASFFWGMVCREVRESRTQKSRRTTVFLFKLDQEVQQQSAVDQLESTQALGLWLIDAVIVEYQVIQTHCPRSAE